MEMCCRFTEKDLAYIKDMFEWNINALKLVNSFVEKVNNEDIVELLEDVFQMHYDNMNKCLSILKCECKEDCNEDEKKCACSTNEEKDEEMEEGNEDGE